MIILPHTMETLERDYKVEKTYDKLWFYCRYCQSGYSYETRHMKHSHLENLFEHSARHAEQRKNISNIENTSANRGDLS